MATTHTVESLAFDLSEANIQRACFYRDVASLAGNGPEASHWQVAVWQHGSDLPRPNVAHEALDAVKAAIVDSSDLRGHEMIWVAPFRGSDGASTVFIASVHSTVRGAAQGGTRFRPYESFADAMADALRLSEGMTRKSALAGLWWGGGKSVIPRTPSLGVAYEGEAPQRAQLFRSFGAFVASMGGIYYAAEDMGTTTSDMDSILSACRFVTCISRNKGGSGDPSPFTARAVYLGIETAAAALRIGDGLSSLRVSIQGAGHVGARLALLLSKSGAQCVVADYWDRPGLAATRDEIVHCAGVTAIPADAIYDQPADVFCPCAVGGTINGVTIPKLSARGVRLVVGAANNMLANPFLDSRMLAEYQIAYVPDFVINSGGIANCADEASGYLDATAADVIEQIPELTMRVLLSSRRYGVTTLAVAEIMGDEASRVRNPLHPGRSQRILRQLVNRFEGGRT